MNSFHPQKSDQGLNQIISQIQKAGKETDHAKRSALYTSQFDIFIMHYLQQSLIF